MPILQPHTTFHVRRISSVKFTSAHLYGNVYMRVGVTRALAHSFDFGLQGSKGHKNGREIRCLGQWTPINCREKLDSASFILGEI